MKDANKPFVSRQQAEISGQKDSEAERVVRNRIQDISTPFFLPFGYDSAIHFR